MSTAVSVGSFDYVIAGGGTAGLTLAARLSEIPEVSVAVVEAGVDRSDDLNVLAPGLLTSLYGDPTYDWIYHTVPQEHIFNRVVGHPRGKQLGGSSAINYLAYTHASQGNIDSWGELGNEGWSWDELAPYYVKSENFTSPPQRVVEDLQTDYINIDVHGLDGEIHNSFPPHYSVLDEAWPRTYENIGLGVNGDPRDGLALGGYTIETNLDAAANFTRSYSATAYLNPIKDRKNLEVITDALISKIILSGEDKPAATGLEFIVNGTTWCVEATREVLLSAGSFGSPQILELSGVGNKTILADAGIETIVENANVGENLQDHPYMPLGFEVSNPDIFTFDDLADDSVYEAAYEQYLGNATGPLAIVALGGALLSLEQIFPSDEYESFLNEIETAVSATSNCETPGLKSQHDAILNYIRNNEAVTQHMNSAGGMTPTAADTTELFAATTEGNYFTILGVLEHPFSRGTVHIHSANASEHPLIDPHYLEHPADLEMLSKIALHVQNVVGAAAPLSDNFALNGTVLQPDYVWLTEDNVEHEVKRLMQSEYHPAGTCAMMPENEGGVVNNKLQVYGIEGLRVVDASVVPLLPRANIQTTVYAIAERAADWIKEDYYASF
ncbi:hypothetical protein MBLNU230_g2773t1 [Neophaeotheca triangularis]